MTRARLIALRHARPRATGICYGRFDVPIELSAAEAARSIPLSPALAKIDLVWSSPSPRCRDLAAYWAGTRSLPHHVDERLLELSFGRWEGRRWSEIHAEEPEALARWGDSWQTEAPPGGETLRSLEARVDAWRRALGHAESHLLIGHAGVIRALEVLGGERGWDEAMASPVPYLKARDMP